MEAEKVLKTANEICPQCDRPYSALAICYREQGNYEKLQELTENIIKRGVKNDLFYGYIATFFLEQGNYKEAQNYYKKVDRFRAKYYSEATRHNYQKLKETVIQRGIKLVCVQHPMRNLWPLKKAFDSIEGIVFVDNEKIFKEAVRNAKYDDYFRDNFGGDFGHCIPKGNRLLAENIAKVILGEVFYKNK